MAHDTPATSANVRPDGAAYPVARSEEDWRGSLSPQEYHVLREAGTERPFVGEYTDNSEVGIYSCRACGAELFRSDAKFDSHCGWPSFYAPLAKDSVVYIEDRTLGQVRTEVRCATCGGHLGHVFEGEGYRTPTDLRYCINSISMRFASESNEPSAEV
jgi:peptide-methionine (R)-S-oxide reductase